MGDLKHLFGSDSWISVYPQKKKEETMMSIHLFKALFSRFDSLASLRKVSILTRNRCFRWRGTAREETRAGDRVLRHAVKIE